MERQQNEVKGYIRAQGLFKDKTGFINDYKRMKCKFKKTYIQKDSEKIT